MTLFRHCGQDQLRCRNGSRDKSRGSMSASIGRQRLIAIQAIAIGAILTLSLSRARVIVRAAQCFIRALTLAGGLPGSARTAHTYGLGYRRAIITPFGTASAILVRNDDDTRAAVVRFLEASRPLTRQYSPRSGNALRPTGPQCSHGSRDGQMRCGGVTAGCKLD